MQVNFNNINQIGVNSVNRTGGVQRIGRNTASNPYESSGRSRLTYIMKESSMGYVRSMRDLRAGNAYRSELHQGQTRDEANGVHIGRISGAMQELNSLGSEESGYISKYVNDLTKTRIKFMESEDYRNKMWSSANDVDKGYSPLQNLQSEAKAQNEQLYGPSDVESTQDDKAKSPEASEEKSKEAAKQTGEANPADKPKAKSQPASGGKPFQSGSSDFILA